MNLLALNHLRRFGNAPGHINHWNITSFRKIVPPHIEVTGIRSSFPWILAHGTDRAGGMDAAANVGAGCATTGQNWAERIAVSKGVITLRGMLRL